MILTGDGIMTSSNHGLFVRGRVLLSAYIGASQPHYISPTTYAYCKCDQNRLIEIQEKQSYTKYREEEPAASGTFYFDNDETLVASCIELIEAGETVNGEYYVSLLFNSEICQKNRCLVYFIDHFMQWGTPEDLEDYIFAARKVPLRFQNSTDKLLECHFDGR